MFFALFSAGSTGQFLFLRALSLPGTVLSRVHWLVLDSQSSCIAFALFSAGSTGQFLVRRARALLCTVLCRVHWPVLGSQSSCFAFALFSAGSSGQFSVLRAIASLCIALSKVYRPVTASYMNCSQQGSGERLNPVHELLMCRTVTELFIRVKKTSHSQLTSHFHRICLTVRNRTCVTEL